MLTTGARARSRRDPITYLSGVAPGRTGLAAKVIRAKRINRRRGGLRLVVLLIAVMSALPMLHCLTDESSHHAAPAAQDAVSTDAQTTGVSASGTDLFANQSHADTAAHAVVCQTIGSLTVIARGNNSLRAVLVAVVVATAMLGGTVICRSPPLRRHLGTVRSGWLLLTDLCISRR